MALMGMPWPGSRFQSVAACWGDRPYSLAVAWNTRFCAVSSSNKSSVASPASLVTFAIAAPSSKQYALQYLS
jgi:hypothetical protein